jgi:hypothetical protein
MLSIAASIEKTKAVSFSFTSILIYEIIRAHISDYFSFFSIVRSQDPLSVRPVRDSRLKVLLNSKQFQRSLCCVKALQGSVNYVFISAYECCK